LDLKTVENRQTGDKKLELLLEKPYIHQNYCQEIDIETTANLNKIADGNTNVVYFTKDCESKTNYGSFTLESGGNDPCFEIYRFGDDKFFKIFGSSIAINDQNFVKKIKPKEMLQKFKLRVFSVEHYVNIEELNDSFKKSKRQILFLENEVSKMTNKLHSEVFKVRFSLDDLFEILSNLTSFVV
jgi:hypothetical protein